MKVYGQLESAQDENLGSAPSATPWGRRFFNTALKLAQYWNGTSWTALPGWVAKATLGAPTAITTTGVTVLTGGSHQLHFVKGTGGVTVASNPGISAGAFIGQILKLKGTSDTDWLEIPATVGLRQNGSRLLGATNTIQYSWDGTQWSEDFYV